MKNKNKFLMFFIIAYFLFSLYLVLINIIVDIRSFNLCDILGIPFACISIFLIVKYRHKIIENKKVFILIVVLPILLRVGLLLLSYTNIVSDYQFFLGSATSLARHQPIDYAYISLFPYLYPYIYLLGNVMKILGTEYTTVLILNIGIELIGSICFYYLIYLKKGKQSAKEAVLFWLWNPFNILWIMKCCPVTVVNTLLIIVLLVFAYLRKANTTKKIMLLSLCLGLIMSITNSFRPIIIIFIIALFIYFISQHMIQKEKRKINWLSFGVILLTFMVGNQLIHSWISYKIDYALPKNSGGWSIYVGANIKYNGRWNQEDSIRFGKLYDKYGNVKAHEIMQKEGIERYKNLKAKIPSFLVKKSKVLGTGVASYTYFDVFDSVSTKIPILILDIVRVYLSIFWYLILMSNFLISIQLLRQTEDNGLNPYGIFALGLFASTLLVEVHARYFLPIMVVLMVMIMSSVKSKKIKS